MRRILPVALPVVLAGVAAGFGAGPSAATPQAHSAQDTQSTLLISHALDGGLPNGPSTHPVISNDKRYSRVIAFQSTASNLVKNDVNGQEDVFAVFRAGSVGNNGAPWRIGATKLISRTYNGAPSNGPSFAPAVGGGFHSRPRCIAFLSAASNLVRGDYDGKVDAFMSRGPGGQPRRLPKSAGATSVAVSGDCSRVAYTAGGRLYVHVKTHTKRLHTRRAPADPSFSTGLRRDLVFGAHGGVYLSKNGTSRPHRVARGGRNPAYNDIKRHVVAYEITRHGVTQIGYKDLGHRQHIISSRHGTPGDGGSTNPVIGNAGYYVTFQSDATNLATTAGGAALDRNGKTDVYLYTNVRDITLAQSVQEKGVPLAGGAANPSMSFYANYVVFDSPAPLGSTDGAHQVFMRYLGGL